MVVEPAETLSRHCRFWSFGVLVVVELVVEPAETLSRHKFCFLPLLKHKLCVKVGRVGGGIFFQPAFWSAGRLPNKACTRRVGVCAVYKHFSGFGFFLHLKPFPTPPTRG